MEIPLEQVVPDPGQPRQDWSHNDGARRLSELAESVREFGVLQPLVVREDGTIRDGRQCYIIISGARRRAAAERAGLPSLPVVVRGEESSRVRALQLVENLQRQELSPLDEARAYQELIDLEGLTPPALAARLHISPQHVRDRLRVLADQVLADAVERRQLAPSVARNNTAGGAGPCYFAERPFCVVESVNPRRLHMDLRSSAQHFAPDSEVRLGCRQLPCHVAASRRGHSS